ncbi:hypothetical protein AVEN_223304-1 [Araneus ventricosus]|uniref:Uncharacterized protein n=1 Tax=Araneus ventricosus TaxID=182803 RepID=A0A4Y2GBK0_ARAVE|nr:hypothetical protein AVEN_223304-1 [Araneus ventricosus]
MSASCFKATRWLFLKGPRHFEPRSDDEDAPAPSFLAAPAEDVRSPAEDLARNRPTIKDGSSVESGFEPGTLRSRSRDLTATPPRPIIRRVPDIKY